MLLSVENHTIALVTYHLHAKTSTSTHDDLVANPFCCTGRCCECRDEAVADGGDDTTGKCEWKMVSRARYCKSSDTGHPY